MKTEQKIERRGRPRKSIPESTFNPVEIKLKRGSELIFSDSLFNPIKADSAMDLILSTEGGLMPGTNMAIAGGPGSGKSTLVLDLLSSFTQKGYKCLLVSAEMDEIAHYKYCKRIPKFSCIQTLFLKNYSHDVKETLEFVFNQGYDVIAIDSIAEVIDMYKDKYKTTENAAEFWFLSLQDRMKKGQNTKGYYTSFINIQQFTKAGDMAGSNRLKHMVDAYATIERSKDGLERTIFFSKNRDCDKDYKIYFSIYGAGVEYAFNQEESE
jgi:DNA repair protein RadA/Sms